MADESIGQKLDALRRRAGFSMDEVARRLGLRGRSSVQRFFKPDLEKLKFEDALRLADIFDGQGEPPITRQEVLNLSGVNLAEVRPNDTLPPRYMQLQKDVPAYGTAMGSVRDFGNGQEVEEAFIDRSDVIEYFTRPPGYANRTGLYGLYVTGSSMEPRWDSGDPLYVDPKRPPAIGDDVVVYLKHPRGESHELEAVLIKRLERRTATMIELRQYNPEMTFQLEMRRIAAVHRVIPKRELLAFN